ncbi:serine hydrolase domain-containing protein [Pseudomonas sp. KCJK9016]|uniref:serine hydrolase domain-containing protein n=1 Tax=Pseudomonas sp. KCJK9016 TaxID=3344556 RepID=UPI0039066CAC
MWPLRSKRTLLIVVLLVLCVLMLLVTKKTIRIWQLSTIFDKQNIVENFRSMPEILNARTIRHSGKDQLFSYHPKSLPVNFDFKQAKNGINEWIKDSDTTGLLVLVGDQVVFERYYQGNTAKTTVIAWSVTKSFLSLLIGIALNEGAISSIQDPVSRYVPSLKDSAYKKATIENVLEMSSGVKFNEDYSDRQSDINRLGLVIGVGGSIDNWLSSLKDAGKPAYKHNYISADTQVLGMVLKGATGKGAAEYMQEKLWSRLGAECDGKWLTDDYGTELVFGGLNLCLRDFARLGLLYLHKGRNQAGDAIVDERWILNSTQTTKNYLLPGRFEEEGQPNLGYGYQWWIPKGDEGEFMAIGVYGQFIYVNQQRQVVIAKTSAYANYNEDGVLMEYKTLEAFRAIARQMVQN